jgi:hypothetical protein
MSEITISLNRDRALEILKERGWTIDQVGDGLRFTPRGNGDYVWRLDEALAISLAQPAQRAEVVTEDEGFHIAAVIVRDGEGREFVAIGGGKSCALEGEMPGEYYPVSLDETSIPGPDPRDA